VLSANAWPVLRATQVLASDLRLQALWLRSRPQPSLCLRQSLARSDSQVAQAHEDASRLARGAGRQVRCSDAGIALIKEFEGFQPQPYDDLGGKPTVGFGHLIKQGESFSQISESQATSLLCSDLVTAEACIEDCVDVPLTQNQFDALCSFVFNLGCLKLRGSTLLRHLNNGAYDLAADEFQKWCRVGQNQVEGLLRRRLAEKLLFETP